MGVMNEDRLTLYDGLIKTHITNTTVAKETGKGLSTNDYTTAEKSKLDGLNSTLLNKLGESSKGNLTFNGSAVNTNTDHIVDTVAEAQAAIDNGLIAEGDTIYVKEDSDTFTFKGSCLSTDLPLSGNSINDTYYCTDTKCRMTWNGGAWYQSSLSETEYADELASLKNECEASHNELKGDISRQNNNISNFVNALKSVWNSRHTTSRKFSKYFLPFSLPINLISDGYNFYHDFDIEKYKNPESAIYYVSPTGSSSNDGLTEDNPKNLFDFILNRDSLDINNITIICLDGVYRDFAISSPNFNNKIRRNWNIVAKNKGKVIFANIGAELSYVKDSIYTNCYTTTRSSVTKFIQKYDEKFLELTKVTNEAECNNTVGSWYLDSSNKLYVHLFFEEIPTYQTTFALINYGIPVIDVDCSVQNVNLYLDGIICLGGTPSTVRFFNSESYTDPHLYAKDCKFLFAYDSTLAYDAVDVWGATGYFVRCEASYSSKDGFNYHWRNNVIPKFIEINCIGANNGMDGVAEGHASPYQNGSSCHDGGYGIRINGIYYNNYGCNVADVNDNTKTVNILCDAFDSGYNGDDYYNADFSAQKSGATMYLDNCRAFGSKHSAYCITGATIYLNNCELEVQADGDGIIN